MTVYDSLLKARERHGCCFLVLLDPDRKSGDDLISLVSDYENAGADAFLFGSSLMMANKFEHTLSEVKKATDKPVILFPASSSNVCANADAILYLSLISGRNPNLLIEEHVKSAPMIKALNLETIPTGYMLIESGVLTSVSYLSNTLPIPRDKPEIACAHALAGQYLGMKLIYLEAGSGALYPVPEDMVTAVGEYVDIPVMVGGGITDPEYAGKLAEAGASMVVVGNALERDPSLAKRFTEALHWK